MLRKINAFLFAVLITLLVGFIFFGLGTAFASIEKASDLLRHTTVRVNGISCSGSGSVVAGRSGKKYLVTNAHVCNCARYKGGLFATYDNGEVLHSKVVKVDWSADLCAGLIFDDKPALHIGHTLEYNTEVITRGYPAGFLAESHGRVKGKTEWDADYDIDEVGECPKGSRKGYTTRGTIAVCRMHYVSTLTNLYGRPGSSGSPVVNENGELVGVVSSFHMDEDYDAGIVTFEDTKRFLESL